MCGNKACHGKLGWGLCFGHVSRVCFYVLGVCFGVCIGTLSKKLLLLRVPVSDMFRGTFRGYVSPNRISALLVHLGPLKTLKSRVIYGYMGSYRDTGTENGSHYFGGNSPANSGF